MFFTEEKLEARISELEPFRYRNPQKIKKFQFQLDQEGANGAYPPRSGEWTTMKVGESWGGTDLYAWLAAAIDIPSEWAGRKVVGRFNFGKTSGGTNNGFESLLYVNGEPFQGVDQNHQEVFFPKELTGNEVQLHFRLWSGLGGYKGYHSTQEHLLKQAEIVWLDEAADDLYYTSTAVLETVITLAADSPERYLLLTALNKAMNRIDWRKPGSDAFYESVVQANDLINSELQQMEKHHPVTVWCIGHTHIDVAWLWRLRHTREKCARSFSTVLRLMDQYPEYVFLQTQPQLYDYLKSDYPAIYEQIMQKVREGQWEPEGGMWLEADCNLTSGESLVRQILMGTRFLKEEFGTDCEYLWLPDVFGYCWALPQILKKSGINVFLTSKLSRNQYNRIPHDTFNWRGIDGSEILTHLLTTPANNPKVESWFTYNGRITPKTVQETWNSYRNKEINQEMLLSYGYGDGGGGVNREMLEMHRRIENMPGLPHVKTGKAGAFFRQLKERIANSDNYVHTWDGELYLETHRGTYTSQAYNKRMNRRLELLYREVEWLSSLECLEMANWASYPQQKLNEGWKIILRNQFHDIIPGSSIREVYEDCRLEYEEAEKIGLNLQEKSLRAIVAESATVTDYTIFNSASWSRSEMIAIPLEDGMNSGQWHDIHGNPLIGETQGNQWLVQVKDVPSMGYTKISLTAGTLQKENPAAFTVLENGIRSPFYELGWNKAGQLTRISDLETGREVLAPGKCGNVFQVFEDKPIRYEAWDIDLFYLEKMTVVEALESAEVVEIGALRAVVRFKWHYMDSVIRQDMILYSDNRRIDFVTEIDWKERQQLLKTAFPVNIRATEATYDVQFGNVKRPTHWNTSWDFARFETVGHQWADLSEMNYGVSLLNDCKYGYDIKDNVMRLSLIKSATEPDRQADLGRHSFTYSLYPHQGNWFAGNTARNAWSLNQPLSFCKGSASEPHKSLFRVSCDAVMVDAVKKTEDGQHLLVRMHDYSGGRNQVELESDLRITGWQECDLLERAIGEFNHESRPSFQLLPYEIKTLMIEMAKNESKK